MKYWIKLDDGNSFEGTLEDYLDCFGGFADEHGSSITNPEDQIYRVIHYAHVNHQDFLIKGVQ